MSKIIFLLVFTLIFTVGCAKKPETSEAPIGEDILEEGLAPTTENQAPQVLQPQTATAPVVKDSAEAMSPQLPAASTTVDRLTTENIQQALKNAGIYTGKVDGVLGPKTKKAIEDFQAKNNLKVDGKVGSKTWKKLKMHLAGVQQSSSSVTAQ
ncbi:MAG: peptidoglycan-binding domain-containing protein [Candidatus Omnitrophota bacterium]|nr:peptidoglycan-binding domain-containing protein [Candidatus Omnitrophota bacterium]